MMLESLSEIKNPPVVYAKQANIAHVPQQVNNGIGPSRARKKTGIRQANFWSRAMKTPMDAGAPGATGGSDSAMEAVGEIDRPSST
jgi:hypothetical protein